MQMLIILVLIASLIIRTFQLIFSAGTVFFSHDKSARTLFRLIFFSEANVTIFYKSS